jgi:hypothetical protein
MDTLCKALIFVPLAGALAAGVAGCSESAAPPPAPIRPAQVSYQGGGVSAYPTVALGSGTGSAADLHSAADFVPDDDVVAAPPVRRGGGAFGVGIRPGNSASGIRP